VSACCLFFPLYIGLIRAQGIPKYKIGFGDSGCGSAATEKCIFRDLPSVRLCLCLAHTRRRVCLLHGFPFEDVCLREYVSLFVCVYVCARACVLPAPPLPRPHCSPSGPAFPVDGREVPSLRGTSCIFGGPWRPLTPARPALCLMGWVGVTKTPLGPRWVVDTTHLSSFCHTPLHS
jgi:hypothetical protein